ncbi:MULTISPECIES: inorganic phosphate transporter [Mucilaginibacter]|uniref:inorganic phosphate transporter n=1 Tax=Mucilaginibacter TaxID=423349 RepID=UPI00209026C1|nr:MULTISPECIES: inorganic phosphate transporter [Mucilaginibacter]MCO5937395.1 inorganic phosphate transporter [Mucilaginibacter aurantiaciroseus]MEB0260442.1 inorganic phosphate transporter [Mucilaginibacter sp. 10I4]MEB0280023.1 inorganic phosphate transporter [Mucilaginibacter sp. 10B2]MEB0301339.1 inorganic phosphate transporter [Mucilaginibacter sp. 5C4]WPX23635.1 inorganic phosphate transporter [Mucilaginibacter sp. 5C4]
MVTTLLVAVIALALIFDYTNGFHDAANSIATIVSTKVLTPFQAVLLAAVFNFAAYFFIKDHKVANTVAKTVHEEFITLHVVLAGLIAAITWNLTTWWFGIPSSSSHTLIGGFAGAGITNALFMGQPAMAAINSVYIIKIVAYIVLAPFIGLFIAYFITIFILHVCKKAKPVTAERWFKRLQLVSAAALSFAHGTNDAQKVMGILYVSLVAAKVVNSGAPMPEWIPLSCYTAISLGTMSGGWKIVKTMGSKITKITPLEGVAAETAGAITLFITEHFAIPVSTTHTITGSIIGVGLTKRVSAVRWGVTINLVWAWIITIPISALIAGLMFMLVRHI